MSFRCLSYLVTLVLAVLTGLAAGPAGFAAQATPDAAPEPPAFIFHPADPEQPYFNLEMEAGTQQEAAIVIGAEGDQLVDAHTFAADVFSLVNGGFGVRSLGEPASGTTTWLNYESGELQLQPGELIERTFTIAVPEGTPPGQYITSLVLQTAQPIAVGESTMLQQTIRKAVAVLITVPGPVTPEFTIGEASLRQSLATNSLLIDIANSGNVLLKPAGEVIVTSADGTELVRAPIAMGSVYAGTSTQIELPIPVLLEPGAYSIAVSLTDAATGVTAEASDLALQVEAVANASPVAAPVTVDSLTVEAVTEASGAVQLANVAVAVNNAGTPLPAVRLTLHVIRDGQPVEDYVLSPSLALPTGITTIEQRYLPAGGWQQGTYEFSLTLEAIDLATGQTTLLHTVDATSDVVVP